MNWKVPDEIYIQTPTGSGKTTFVLETLAAHALSIGKEVLLLVNRKILKKQIKKSLARQHGIEGMDDEQLEKIKNFGGITVLSYQEIQAELSRTDFFLSTLNDQRFFFIVFDEIHYLLQDAVFNREIIYLTNAIPKIDRSVKVFVSATMEEVKPFLKRMLHTQDEESRVIYREEGKKIEHFQKTFFTGGNVFSYKLEPCYNIRKIKYFRELDILAQRINHDATDDKWPIFVNSKSEAKELKKLITHDVAYLDADVDEENAIKKQIISEEQFSEKVLVTTKVLDNGANLKDPKLRNIVLLTVDKTDFIQMFGRKRFNDEEEGVNLYLAARNVRFFNALRNMKLQPMMECVKKLRTDNKFEQRRFDDDMFFQFCMKMSIVTNKHIILSEAAGEKLRLESEFCDRMIDVLKDDPNAFIREQLSWLGQEFEFNPEEYLEHQKQEEERNEMEEFLANMIGQKMDKTAQGEFRLQITDLAKKMGKKLTDRKTRCAGKAALNRFFRTEGLPFCIESVGNSKFWLVKEVNGNVTVDVCD